MRVSEPMSGSQVWRVVCEGGEVREVTACKRRADWIPLVDGPEYRADEAVGTFAYGSSLRIAVANLAIEARWPVVEIVATGAQTSEERLAQVIAERDALQRMLMQDAEALGIDHAGDIPEAIRALMSRCDDADVALRLLTTERDRWRTLHAEAMTAHDRIATAMVCRPDDLDDLVEAVRLLVAERDTARAEADALRRDPVKGAARLRWLVREIGGVE